MQFRIGIGVVVSSVIIACAGLAGCTTGGSSGGRQSFMQSCEQNATSKQARSECAWKNAERMASGN